MSSFLGQDFEAKSKGSEEALRNVEEQAADSASVVRLTNCFYFVYLLSTLNRTGEYGITLLCLKQWLSPFDLNTLIVQHDIQRYFIISAVIITKLHFY